MLTTIIIDHPWEKSFNHALLNELVGKLEAEGKPYEIIDLYKDGFNPVMQQAELAVYQSGITEDPIVNKYIDILRETSQLVFIFPIWWYTCPAGLTGFFNKVLLNNVAFYDEGAGVQPLLKIDSAVIFSTSEQPTKQLLDRCHGSFQHQLTTTLNDVGVQQVNWHNLGFISSLAQEERVLFLENAYDKVKEVATAK